MWPWEHLAFGYLLYSGLVHFSGRSPRDYPTLALAFGTQFPDLVDKPLAWTFGILPNGRSLTHSLLTAFLLIVVLQAVFYRYGYPSLATAFGVGYLSHLAGDALAPALAGQYYYLSFLAWPVLPPIDYGEKSFIAVLSSLDLTGLSAVTVGFVALVVGLWALDGRPGLRPILALPRRTYRRLGANW